MEDKSFITYKYKKLDGSTHYITINPSKTMFFDNFEPQELHPHPHPDDTHVRVFDLENKCWKILSIQNIFDISNNNNSDEQTEFLNRKFNSYYNLYYCHIIILFISFYFIFF